jgi:hypothetical protein
MKSRVTNLGIENYTSLLAYMAGKNKYFKILCSTIIFCLIFSVQSSATDYAGFDSPNLDGSKYPGSIGRGTYIYVLLVFVYVVIIMVYLLNLRIMDLLYT